MPLFVGIDLAIAKRKRLPICVCEWQAGRFVPLLLPNDLYESIPRGHGNKATLDKEIVDKFVGETEAWLFAVENELKLTISSIAIDAPRKPASHNQRRQAELEMDKRKISCFTTPSATRFTEIRRKVQAHLDGGGAESRLPHANQLWMLAGFALFEQLSKQWNCLEVFPQATMHCLEASGTHKSKGSAVLAQLEAISVYTGWPMTQGAQALSELKGRIRAPGHDAVDAYASAWIAALKQSDRTCLGDPPDDVIWIPNTQLLMTRNTA